MPETDLRQSNKEMLVKNLMLQTTPDQIGDDLPLFGPGGLGLDSIDALEIVLELQRSFGVEISDEETGKRVLRSVGTIVEFIAASRQPAG
jgi:acyl carrier protein